MIKLLNQIQQQILDALNKVEAPNLVCISDEDDESLAHPWVAQGEFNDRPILAFRRGAAVQFALDVDGTVTMMTRYYSLTRDDLFQVNAYMRACEEVVAALDDGETLVQRRDLDEILGNTNCEFRKTDAYRRLDNALGV